MKSIFRATALLSGSSVASILLSLVSTKILASILQPAGYGYYGLLLSVLSVASLVAGMGMTSGLTRLGAARASEGDHLFLANLRAGAWLLCGALGLILIAILAVFRRPVSSWALGSPDHEIALLMVGVSTWFAIAIGVQNGILNAYHRVEALAAYGVVNSFVNASASISCVLLWRQNGVVPAVVAASIASWLASCWFLWRNVKSSPLRVSLGGALRSARSLLSFGIPFTASSAIGSGIQLALPILVLHLLNTEAVAYYKAAAAISVGYLGFLVTAMGQDYYPRLSAVREKPASMLTLIHEQYRLVMLLVVPMILGTLALVPYLVPLVYSRRFILTVDVLEWQLIGDLFKFSSWTMAYAVLARCKPSVYFCVESIGGLVTLGTAWLGVRMFGLVGLGIGFLVSYAIYYVAVRTILRRELPFRETVGNRSLLLAGMGAALVIRMLPSTRFAGCRTAVALALAIGFGCYSLRVLCREYLAGKTLGRRILIAS